MAEEVRKIYYKHSNHTMIESVFVNNQKHGMTTEYSSDGKTIRALIPYVHGLRHGTVKVFNVKNPGRMCEENWRLGLLEGTSCSWFSQGERNYISTYKSMLTNGIYVSFDWGEIKYFF